MADLIERSAVLKIHERYRGYMPNEKHHEMWKEIKDLIPVDAVPVRHGRWVYDKNGMDWDLPAWICSECHDRNDMIPTHVRGIDGMIQVKNPLIWSGSSYCPNCGAKMDGKDES